MNDHSGKEDSCFKKIVKSAICLCRLAHRIKNNWCCAICFLLIALLIICCWNLCSDVQSLTETTNALKESLKKSGAIFSSHSADLEIKHLKERLDTLTDYQSSILAVIGIIATLFTVVVAGCGILAPFLINRGYEKRFNEEIEYLKTKFNDLKKNAEDAAKEAKKSEIKADLSKQFTSALNETDYKKQIDLYEKLIKTHIEAQEKYNIFTDEDNKQNLSAILNNIANAKSELMRFKDAIEDYNEAIELNSKDASYYYNRALAKSELEEYAKAIQDFGKAIEIDSTDARYYSNRAIAKSELEKYEEAILDFDKTIELDSTEDSYYYNRAIAKLKLEKCEEAILDFDKAIELDSSDAGYYYNRAITKSELEEYEKAILDFDKAIELDPTDAVYYSNRAIAKLELEKYEEAILDFDKAIELDPTDDSYYYNRAITKSELKKYEEAIQDFDKAIELDSTDDSYYYNRAITKSKLDKNEEAIQDFDKAIELDSTKANYFINRAVGKFKSKKFENAIFDCDIAIKLDPENSMYFNVRANCNLNHLDLANAIIDIEKAIQINSNEAIPHVTKGEILHQLKRYKDAEHAFNHAIKLDEGLKVAYEERAKLYRDMSTLKEFESDAIAYTQLAESDEEKAKELEGNSSNV